MDSSFHGSPLSPRETEIDFDKAIQTTRLIVRRAQSTYCHAQWKTDRITRTIGDFLSGDTRFDIQLRDQRKLLERGQVAWASILQANDELFVPKKRGNRPAAILYTLDNRYDACPGALINHAQWLDNLKERRDLPADIQLLVSKLAEEYIMDLKVPVPPRVTNGIQCYYATLLISRAHLPGHHLAQSLLPVLVNPKETNAVMIVPNHYWDPTFAQAWLTQEFISIPSNSFSNAPPVFVDSSSDTASVASTERHNSQLLGVAIARFSAIKFVVWTLFLVGMLIVSWLLFPVIWNWNPQARNDVIAIGAIIIGAFVVAGLAPIGLTLLSALFLPAPFFEHTEAGNTYFRLVGAGTVRELKRKSAIRGIVFCVFGAFAYWLVVWLRFH